MLRARARKVNRTVAVGAIMSAAALMTSCGTRLPHTAIESAAGSAAVQGSSGAATASGGTGSSAGSATPVGTAGAALAGGGGGSSSGPASGGTAAMSSSGGPSSGSGPSGSAGGGGQSGGPSGSAGGGSSAGSGSAGATASSSPIVIGSVGDYSGTAGASEVDGPKALQVWAQWVNAHGGVDGGHPVQVIVEDDGMDPSRYQSEIQDLVQNKHVLAFVDNFAPFTIQAGSKYLDSVHVPVIGGDGAEYVWNQDPMLFNAAASFVNAMKDDMEYIAKAGKGKKFGAFVCEEASACAATAKEWFNNGDAKAAGLDPVYEANISIAQPDFTAECLQARQAGVQVLTVVADVDTTARVAQSCDRQGFDPQYFEPAGTMNSYLATLRPLQGALVPVNNFPWTVTGNPAVSDFVDAYNTYAKGQPMTPTATQGWSGAVLFQQAAQNIGNPPSRALLLQHLWAMKGNTLGGLAPPLTFVQNQPAPQADCEFEMQVVDSKLVAPFGMAMVCNH